MTFLADEPRALQNTPLKTRTLESAQQKTARPDPQHISASQLKSYSGCPLAWRLSRTHRPEHVSASLVFGTAFHAAAERFYQMRLEGKTATFQDLMEAYDAKWRERTEPGDGTPPPPVKYSAKAGSEALMPVPTWAKSSPSRRSFWCRWRLDCPRSRVAST